MSEHETAEAINEQAMRWVALLDREAGARGVEAELEAWLAGDTRRQGAFLRAQAAWSSLDRVRFAGEAAPEPPSRRRLFLGGGALAASLVAGAGGWLALENARALRIRTGKGEVRRIPLQDGSLAVVNTSSRLEVSLGEQRRTVKVDDGEAWFEVADDQARPFVVAVGDVRVRATGTAFSVKRMDRGAVVQVTEGMVETWCVGEPERVLHLQSGARAFVAPNATPAVAARLDEEINRSLAWRAGLIILDGDTLGEAAAEFNRYNARQIRIQDQALAAQTYVGRFRTNEPEAFVKAVTLTLDARAIETRDGFAIARR